MIFLCENFPISPGSDKYQNMFLGYISHEYELLLALLPLYVMWGLELGTLHAKDYIYTKLATDLL